MGDELKSIVRDMHEALNRRDIEKAISYFDENAVMKQPEGTFKGTNEIRRYLEWLLGTWPKLEFSENALVVEGNMASQQFTANATSPQGVKGSLLCLSLYEFENQKVKELNVTYDRLSVADHFAESMGWLSKKAVSSIVKQMEKGLR